MIGFLLLSLVFIVFQTTFVPVNVLAAFWSLGMVYFDAREWPLIAFLTGLFYDLFSGRPLGVTSLILLGLTIIVFLYCRKWKVSNPLFVLGVTLLGDFVLRQAWGEQFIVWNGVLVAVVTALWWWFRQRGQGEGKIRLDL